jgi:hypothetical protein
MPSSACDCDVPVCVCVCVRVCVWVLVCACVRVCVAADSALQVVLPVHDRSLGLGASFAPAEQNVLHQAAMRAIANGAPGSSVGESPGREAAAPPSQPECLFVARLARPP